MIPQPKPGVASDRKTIVIRVATATPGARPLATAAVTMSRSALQVRVRRWQCDIARVPVAAAAAAAAEAAAAAALQT